MDIVMRAIGHVEGGRVAAEDDRWGGEEAVIRLDPAVVGPEALLGLDAFSHCEVVFQFDRLPEAEITTNARHPRGNPAWPRVGILAQRGRNRPNRIGVSVAEVLAVDGLALHVRGLDAIAGTPVLDVKPVMAGFLPHGAVREPEWAQALMADYW